MEKKGFISLALPDPEFQWKNRAVFCVARFSSVLKSFLYTAVMVV
jgi:hypothetical protein